MLRQAGRLLFRRLVKALLVNAYPQAVSRILGSLPDQLRVAQIARRHRLDLRQVRVQPQPVPARLLQVLGSPHKSARPSLDSFLQRAEIAARLRSKKQHRLLRFRRNHNKNTLFPNFPRPGLHSPEPVSRRRIGRPAKERHDQHVVRRLGRRQVRVNPQPVPRKQARHLRNRQRNPIPLNVNIHLRPHQIKRRSIRPPRPVRRNHRQDKHKRNRKQVLPTYCEALNHALIVRMRR